MKNTNGHVQVPDRPATPVNRIAVPTARKKRKRRRAANPMPYPLVMVEWLDSHAVADRWHRGEPSKEALKIWSVGWVLHDSEKVVTLSAHIADEKEDRQRCGSMTIPRQTILRVIRLR